MGGALSYLAFTPPPPSYADDRFEWLGDVPFFLLEPGVVTDTALVVSHGNACDLGHSLGACQAFQRWTGAAVACYDYPGYGPRSCSSGGVWGAVQRTAKVGFRGAANNLRRALAEVRARGYTRIFLVGWSVGSGPTCEVAAEEGDEIAGVLLITPVHSAIGTLFTPPWPVTALDALTNHQHVPNIAARVSVIHGTADEVVPFDHGLRLHGLAREPGRFAPVDGAGHNNLFAEPHIETLREFVASETAVS